jgi:hypothetical protein
VVDTGSYLNVLSSDVTTTGTAQYKTISSAGGNFSAADVGQPISDTQTSGAHYITPGTTIAAVLNPRTAVLSAVAATAGANFTAYIGGVPISPALTTTNASAVVTAGANPLTDADINRVIVGDNIPANDYILDGDTSGTTFTLGAVSGGSGSITHGTLLGSRVAGVVTTLDSVTVTAPNYSFATSDIGRHIIAATNIPPGTVITAIATNGAGATLSNAATGAGTVVATVGGSPTRQVSVTAATGNMNVTVPANSFSLADVGRPLLGAPVTGSTTTVTGITSNTVITISANGASATPGPVTVSPGALTSGTAVPSVATTSGETAITASAGTFTTARIGQTIYGLTIPVGTTITGVNATGTTATLSQPANGASTATVYLFAAMPVPVGAYTLTYVTDGRLDAPALNAAAQTEYSQSAVSSGSSFTVAQF